MLLSSISVSFAEQPQKNELEGRFKAKELIVKYKSGQSGKITEEALKIKVKKTSG